ncbi:MAG: DUF3298 and DUF4163 domain-containing protein [Firmicutes bacterium]|nr:DUF3298 and DUF4163 domain-containing protein [Bacillota bacterium]
MMGKKRKPFFLVTTVLLGIMILLTGGIQAQGAATKESPEKANDGALLAEIQALVDRLSSPLQGALTNRIQQLKGDIYVETKIIQAKNNDLEIDAELPIIPETHTATSWVNADVKQRFLKAQLEIEDCRGQEHRPSHPYSLHSRYEIPHNQDGLLSIVTENYQYTGGAHGMTFKTAYNVDLKQGRLLHLRDFFPEGDNYLADIKAQIKEALNTAPESECYFPAAADTIDAYEGDFPFYIQGENIVIFFHPYELACYAAGFREFAIPWDVLP